MASLQERNGVFNCIFCYQGKRHWLNLGKVPQHEADAVSAKVDYFLLRLKQGLLEIPPGCDVCTFVKYDGKPPSKERCQEQLRAAITLKELRDKYLEVNGNGSLEDTTLSGIRQHFKHWLTTLPGSFPINTLSLADLQKHVDRRMQMDTRRGKVSPGTIKKEIITLRTCWNWAVQFGLVVGKFPNKGLRYPKMDEKPPFQTIAEVERRIAANRLTKKQEAELWDAVYLTIPEITELLEYAKAQPSLPWVYPMICFVAHTGTRRSEVIRVRIADLDIEGNTITVNEKKRVRGERSTRRVPMTGFLKSVLQDWLKIHPGGEFLFCQASEVFRSPKRSRTTGHESKNRATTVMGRLATVRPRELPPGGPLTKDEAHNHLKSALAKHPKWSKVKGFHTFRHSFISGCATKGIDQRMLQSWCGHMTPEMSKRYTHLYPNAQQKAMDAVFS